MKEIIIERTQGNNGEGFKVEEEVITRLEGNVRLRKIKYDKTDLRTNLFNIVRE